MCLLRANVATVFAAVFFFFFVRRCTEETLILSMYLPRYISKKKMNTSHFTYKIKTRINNKKPRNMAALLHDIFFFFPCCVRVLISTVYIYIRKIKSPKTKQRKKVKKIFLFLFFTLPNGPFYRARELERFRTDPECFVLLLGRKGAHGLDLSFVTHMFLMDQIWDRSLETQVSVTG